MERQRTVKTRIVAHPYVSTVESQINDFTKQLAKENKEIIDIKYQANDTFSSAMIIYYAD